MREGNFSGLPRSNPITQAAHKREVFWQIAFPLIIGVLVILSLAVGTGFLSNNLASQAANISAIWLILPVLIFTFIFLALLAGLTFGLIKLISILPPYAAMVQNFFVLIKVRVRQASDVAAEPVIKVASARAWLRALFGIGSSKRN